MDSTVAVADRADALAVDERWTAWVARGAAHDRLAAKRAIAAAVVIAGGLGLWLAIALLRG